MRVKIVLLVASLVLADLAPGWEADKSETWDRRRNESIDDHQRRIERWRDAPPDGRRQQLDQQADQEDPQDTPERSR
jgi:hypothetical protein